MSTDPDGENRDRAPDDLDLVGEDENPEGVRQINPLKGLLDASSTPSDSPAGDADAPAPPG
jgi:hypothetical protein